MMKTVISRLRSLKMLQLILKEVIRKYPNAKIDLYGHSLGSMNIQYALACLTEEEASHIGTVHLYNGPNAYSILTPEQKAHRFAEVQKSITTLTIKIWLAWAIRILEARNPVGLSSTSKLRI